MNNISFRLKKGEIISILGESGAGKSTLVKCIMGIEKVDSGEILFEGEKINSLGKKERRKLYKNIQIIFQEARNCLNPRRKANELICEPQKYMKLYRSLEARALMVKPRLLICDEAVSALDVGTQLQILQLLLKIQEKNNIALLMISHDIQLLKRICNRVVVIKEGVICETIEKSFL